MGFSTEITVFGSWLNMNTVQYLNTKEVNTDNHNEHQVNDSQHDIEMKRCLRDLWNSTEQ